MYRQQGKDQYLDTNIREYLSSYVEMSLLIVELVKSSSNTMAETVIATEYSDVETYSEV